MAQTASLELRDQAAAAEMQAMRAAGVSMDESNLADVVGFLESLVSTARRARASRHNAD